MCPSVDFILSLDTEEDNWIPSREGITTTNARQIPEFDERLRGLGIRPTYFVSYQVAVSSEASAILRAVHGRGGSEIGAHLHPWNTPPHCGLEASVTMLKNYPTEVQEQKVRTLVHAIESNLRVRPTAFRAGRFGFDASTVPALIRNGLLVDSSVTPLLTWESHDNGPNFVDAPHAVYRFGAEHPLTPIGDDAPMTEVPISVCGTQLGPHAWQRLARFRDFHVVRRLRLTGMANRMGLFRWVILSPETNGVSDMVAASRRLVESGVRHLHMFLHSNSLAPGMGPFARSPADVDNLLNRIDSYLENVSRFIPLSFTTVSETAARSSAPVGQHSVRRPS